MERPRTAIPNLGASNRNLGGESAFTVSTSNLNMSISSLRTPTATALNNNNSFGFVNRLQHALCASGPLSLHPTNAPSSMAGSSSSRNRKKLTGLISSNNNNNDREDVVSTPNSVISCVPTEILSLRFRQVVSPRAVRPQHQSLCFDDRCVTDMARKANDAVEIALESTDQQLGYLNTDDDGHGAFITQQQQQPQRIQSPQPPSSLGATPSSGYLNPTTTSTEERISHYNIPVPRLLKLPDSVAGFMASTSNALNNNTHNNVVTPRKRGGGHGHPPKKQITRPHTAPATASSPQPQPPEPHHVAFSIGSESFEVPQGLTKAGKHQFVVESRIQKCLTDKEAYKAAIQRGIAAQKEQRELAQRSMIEANMIAAAQAKERIHEKLDRVKAHNSVRVKMVAKKSQLNFAEKMEKWQSQLEEYNRKSGTFSRANHRMHGHIYSALLASQTLSSTMKQSDVSDSVLQASELIPAS